MKTKQLYNYILSQAELCDEIYSEITPLEGLECDPSEMAEVLHAKILSLADSEALGIEYEEITSIDYPSLAEMLLDFRERCLIQYLGR